MKTIATPTLLAATRTPTGTSNTIPEEEKRPEN